MELAAKEGRELPLTGRLQAVAGQILLRDALGWSCIEQGVGPDGLCGPFQLYDSLVSSMVARVL